MNFRTSLSVSQVKARLEQLPIDVNKDFCILEYKNGRVIIMSVSLAIDADLNRDSNYVQIPFTEKERAMQVLNKDIPTSISGNSRLYQ